MFDFILIKMNNIINTNNINKNIITILNFIVLLLLLFIYSLYKKSKWEPYHYKLLFLIIFAFLSEYIIYLVIIKNYDYINHDGYILNKLANEIIYDPKCYFIPQLNHLYKDKTDAQIMDLRNKKIILQRQIWTNQTKKHLKDFTWQKFHEIRYDDKNYYYFAAMDEVLKTQPFYKDKKPKAWGSYDIITSWAIKNRDIEKDPY